MASLVSLLANLQNLDFGKESKEAQEIKHGLKTQEEIARFTIDESMSELERAALFASSNHPLQRLSVITALPSLLATYREAAFDAVLPSLQVHSQIHFTRM